MMSANEREKFRADTAALLLAALAPQADDVDVAVRWAVKATDKLIRALEPNEHNGLRGPIKL